MPMIRLDDVNKSYERGGTKAVANLTLEIGDAEFMCLLGPSGCGKTTTLRMIAGLENLTSGEISVGDRVVDSTERGVFVAPEHRGMGLVFQSYALWPHLTIERNTDFGLRLRKVPKAEREQRVNHVLETLGIAQYRDRYPSQLSGGQQQRVALARMLAVNPSVLLLDEPLSNLDARLRLEMRAELKRIHAEFGTTIVFVTHDQWEAMTLATSIAVMNEGSLQQIATPEDIYDRPANRFVAEFVGNPPINIIEIGDDRPGPLPGAIAAYLVAGGTKPGEVGSIGMRPENIILAEARDGAAADGFADTATVSAILPTGGSWILELAVEGERLFVTANQPPTLNVNDQVGFRVERRAILVFDTNGNRIAARDELSLAEADVALIEPERRAL